MLFKKLSQKSANVSTQLKASAAYTVCSVLQRCLSFITLPLFSRILTTDEYGLSTVYSSTMSLLIVFTSLQLPYGTFNTAMVKFEDDRAGYVASVNGLCTILMAIYFAVYFAFRSFWNKWLDLPTVLMIVMGFEMLFSTSINFWMGKQRFEYKYKKVIALTLSQSVLAMCAGIAAVLLSKTNKGENKVIAYSAVTVAIGLVIYIHSIITGKKFFNRKYWHYALTFNLPLIPYYLSQMIFNQSDRLMINSICGRSDAAKYSVAYSLAIILAFVVNAINNSYIPWFYEKVKEKNFADNKKVSFAIAFFMAFLLLGVIVLAPEIIFIMAGDKYEEAVWVVPPVAMSLLFNLYTGFCTNIEFYYEEKWYLVAGSILSAVVNIVLNAIFIPPFGFVAAAYTTLFSFILFAACNYLCMYIVCKKHNLDFHIYDTKKLILLSLVFMALGFAAMALYKIPVVRYAIVGVVLVICAVFWKKIYKTIKYYFGLFR